jgi:hypothetical protein
MWAPCCHRTPTPAIEWPFFCPPPPCHRVSAYLQVTGFCAIYSKAVRALGIVKRAVQLEEQEMRHEYTDKHQKKVFEDVLAERRYQDRQWGHEIDDTKNTPWMWTAYVCSYATKWMKDPFRFKREDTNEFYDRMIETAAIAAAACESVLRQRDMNGKTFYEPN